MANDDSPEQNENHCSAINSSIPLTLGSLPTLTLSGKIRVTVTFFLFLLSTIFNTSFLLKLQNWTQRKENRKKLSRMKVLLKHLTLANLLETLIVMPLDGMWNITVQWYAGELLCKVLSYLKLFSMYAPAFMMVVISLDRSLAITRPLAVKSNSKLGQFMIGLAWLLSSIFAGPQVNQYCKLFMEIQISYLNLNESVVKGSTVLSLGTWPQSQSVEFNHDSALLPLANILTFLGFRSCIYKTEVMSTWCTFVMIKRIIC